MTEATNPSWGPFIPECKRRGIGRTMAYELKRRGLVETFLIGSKRMVKIASLESLPDRLAKMPQGIRSDLTGAGGRGR